VQKNDDQTRVAIEYCELVQLEPHGAADSAYPVAKTRARASVSLGVLGQRQGASVPRQSFYYLSYG